MKSNSENSKVTGKKVKGNPFAKYGTDKLKE